jgi:uncharacterized repeat protein (TIGR01451 family)
MKQKLLLALLLLLYSSILLAQTPGISWMKKIGGNKYDYISHVSKLLNGDFICSGFTESTNGNAVGNHGERDFMIQCISQQGQIKWSKVIGGTKEEGGTYNGNGEFSSPTADGGFYFTGYTTSSNGDIPLTRGLGDIYLAKFDAAGNIQWSKTYGGDNGEFVSGIQSTNDGGCIISATSYSHNNGQVPANNSGNTTKPDVWILKLDQSGNIQWTKMLGGTLEETGQDIKVTTDGGYIFTALVESEDGDLAGSVTPGSIRKKDAWIVKLDGSGTIVWKKRFGGSDDEDLPKVIITSTGEIVLGLSSRSIDIDFTSNIGIADMWIVKLTSSGDVIWKKHMGGYSWDTVGNLAEASDGNYVIAGFSYSSFLGANPFSNRGECDITLFKLDRFNGSVKWFASFGGGARDFTRSLCMLPNNEIYIVGSTLSNNGELPGAMGDYDGYIIKFMALNTITGYVFYDYNGNNIKDAIEPFVNNVFVLSTKTGGYTSGTFTTNGYYYNDVDSGAFNTKVNLYNSDYFTSNPDSFATVFTSYYQTATRNIALKPLPGKRDVRSSLFTYSAARPGFESVYLLSCYNAGTDTVASGVIKFVKDSRVSFISSTPAIANSIGDTLYWNFNNFKPLDTIGISIKVKIAAPPVVTPGVWLKYRSEISGGPTDLNPGNNLFLLYHLVTGSYDPNDKMESHGDSYFKTDYDNKEYLNYTIRFQNTGNDTAFKVVVKDTLDSRVDWTSIQMMAISHNYKFQIDSGKYCTWTFDNILLPDSNRNEPKSHGYISYRVRLKNNLSVGDIIKNKASIYFDFNPPIVTNEFQTVIKPDVITALNRVSNTDMKLVLNPNPANQYSLLQISGNLIGKFELRMIDNNGRVISQQILTKKSTDETLQVPLNVQQLSSGVYYLQLQQKEKSWWQKVVMQ